MSSVVNISGMARPSHRIDTQFFDVPTTVPLSRAEPTQPDYGQWPPRHSLSKNASPKLAFVASVGDLGCGSDHFK
jgi:hypothetical protein